MFALFVNRSECYKRDNIVSKREYLRLNLMGYFGTKNVFCENKLGRFFDTIDVFLFDG